jgi:hypothetical protein
MDAAVSMKPVRKPYRMPSQLKLENWGYARTAPTKTAKPIIAQLIGRISLTKPPTLLIEVKPLLEKH